MKQPIEPNKEDCCNSGCNPCIFDVYEQQLKLYQKFLDGADIHQEPNDNAISQLEYTPFVLSETTAICKSHKKLHFKLLNKTNKKVWWQPGSHLIMKYVCDTVVTTRSYTPINLNKKDDEGFTIIVKVYDNGTVSRFLSCLNPGDIISWRGPYISYEMKNTFDRIIIIAQGTGIVAFMDIIEKILINEDDFRRIILYYCCKNEDQILFRNELYNFRAYWNFMYHIFLSSNSPCTSSKYQEPIKYHKLTVQEFENLNPLSLKDQVLLCGSKEFMESYVTLFRKEINKDIDIIQF